MDVKKHTNSQAGKTSHLDKFTKMRALDPKLTFKEFWKGRK